MPAAKIELCQLCDKNVFKYKCPTCYVKYCSLDCFKTHRQSPCEKPKQPEAPSSQKRAYQFTTPDTVPQEILKELGNSDAIKECLKNPHVREIMASLVTSTNPDKAIKEAMLEPIFTELAIAALKTVEPQTFEPASH
uniref:Zinc finger HIT domain-containing protein 3 n=1 Tax=Evadne anonyx TaxID=141404 RepID=A0A9N6WQR8_9CRUS|nr:EOG090X0JQ4 [Evadne anonyx]